MNNNLERLIKQTTPFNNEYVKGELGILYTSSMLNNQSVHFFKPFNITPQQYNILRILRGQYPKVININAIKERMLDKMSDVSRIADRLAKQQLILKQPNMIDKRNADITISEKCLDLLKKIDTDINELQSLMHHLSLEEIMQFNKLIDKVLGFV